MSKPKHTPGPWYVGESEVMIPSPVGERFVGVGAENGRSIARVSRLSMLDAEDLYNAALISAAPELLAACEKMLARLELVEAIDWSGWDDEVAVMREAIAKARDEVEP